MRIVDLYKMSEEERKKALEEQQSLYNERMRQSEEIGRQANQQFNDLISKQGEYDTSKHTTTIGDLRKAYKGSNSFQTVNNSLNNYSKNNSPSIWEKMGYIMDNFGTGVHQGTVGIAQGLFTDSANEMQKGKAKNNNELFNNFINAYAGNDLHHIAQSTLNTINEGINILNDKDKNLWQKMVDINLNTVSNGAKALLPMQGFYSSANQVIGKVSDTDQQLLEMNKNISEPLEERQKKLANEGEKYDGTTKFLGEAGQVIGNMIPSITASAITKNPSVALGVMGASVKGQATQEALDKGMSLDKATQIGDAKALIEVATEKLSGGTKVFGHGSLDDIAEELVKKGAKSKAGKFIMTQLLNAGGEIAEEEISNVLGNAIDKGTTDPDKKVLDMKEAFETMGSTAFTTTMLNLLTGGMVNDYRQISNNMNQYKDANTREILDNSSQNVLKQAENIINENNTPNLQQQSTQKEQTLPTQQINQEQNNVAQNGNIEQTEVLSEQERNNRLKELKNIDTTGMGFLERGKIKTEIRALEQGYNSIEEYQKAEEIKKAQAKQEYEQRQQEKINIEKQKRMQLENEIKESTPTKNAQFKIIQNTNPMLDDYHTGIRSPKDIKTFDEVINDDESFVWGDFSREDAKKALQDGKITVYSSHPIEQGGFVTTSQNMAKDYAGNGKIYSQEVDLNDVAWINGDEGQYAKIDNDRNISKLEQRVQGDDLLNAQDFIEEIKSVGANVDENGYVTLYHRTNQENANNIYKTGKMSAKEDGIFFSTSKEGYNNSNYGDTIVEMKVPAEILELDDIFSDEASVKIPLNNKNEELDVSQYLANNQKTLYNNIKIGETKNINTNNLPQKEKVNLPTKGETINWGENEIKESEKISDEGIAKILTEPNKPNNEKRKLRAFLKANLIDKGMVFEELSRKTGNRELQSKYDYTLTSEARGQNAIGNARYNYETEIDKNGKVKKGNKEGKQLCKSLTDIIDEVGNNQEDFYNYMYHQLNIDRMTLEDRFDGDTGTNYERKKAIKNKPVFGKGVTAEISEKYVKEIEQKHPEFKEYAQDVYDFLDANKQELVKNGVISQETSDLFKEMYPHYVPISRITNKGNAINVPLDTGRTGINTPIKRAKGGNRDIQPLFQTMADRTLQTYRASAKNSFGVELKNTLQRSNQLNQNTELTDIDNILDSMTDETKNNELLQKGENGNNPTFTVFENGKKVTYEISNDMYDALKPKNEIFKRIDESKLSKGLTKFNNFRRGLLTEYNPVFSITNAIKDAQDVLLNSQHATKTYSKIPEATAQILGKGYWYKEYIQNGGEQNSYFRDGEFEAKKTNLPSKIKDKVTLPLRAISNVNNVIEMTPRLAEYIASRENGASIETAMLDASRVTTNFKAGGDFTKTLNRNGFTFLNASVQGMQQQIRNVQEANAKGLKGYATLATKYAIAGIPTLILNNLVWKDDDDYEDLQDYVKDNYYIIGKTENGQFIRIPKGRAVATIQKIVSNANDFIKDTSKGEKIDMDKLGNTFWNDLKEDLNFAKDNLAPNNPFDNNVIAPITQVLQNKTWYGEDLIPSRLKDKPKEEQYDETTDWLSKWIGEQLKVSPIKVNYLLDQYSGGVGDVILPMMTPQAENNVIEDKFSTNPIMKNKYPGKFFEEIDKLNVANNSEKATDLDKVKYKYATDLQSEISDLYKEKREIQNSSKEDSVKKSELEKVQAKINKLAEKGLNEIEKIKINGDTSSIDGINYYKLDGKWKKIEDKDNEKLGEISLKTYADFKNKIKKETDSKKQSGELDEDQQLKDKDEIALLKNSKYSDKEKKEIYSKFINTKDTTYSSLNKITNVNINAYLDYKLQDIKGDEDTKSNVKGKTVSGSKKENVYNYLSNSNLSTVERLYIYGTSYKLDNQGRTILQEAINSSNLSQDEKLEIYGRLTANVEKYKDGTYHWK